MMQNKMKEINSAKLSGAAARWIIGVLIIGLMFTEIQDVSASGKSQTGWDKLIAHGGGDILGYYTTNSLEAMERAVENGISLIEVDLSMTSDGELVLLHDWGNGSVYYLGLSDFNVRLSKKEFMQRQILHRFQALDLEGLIAFLDANPGVQIVADTKDDNLRVMRQVAKKDVGNLDRWVPQAYSINEVDELKAMGYKNIFLSLYKMSSIDVEGIKEAIDQGDIAALVFSEQAADSGYIEYFSGINVPIYIHTINDLEKAVDYFGQGAYGIYTDSIVPWELEADNSYYLMYNVDDWTYKRLEGLDFDTDLKLKVKSPSSSGDVTYSINGKQVAAAKAGTMATIDASAIPEGHSELKVKVRTLMKGDVYEQSCYIWWDGVKGRIVSEKNTYMLENIKNAKDFEETLDNEPQSQGNILAACLVVQKGSSVYYKNGRAEEFLNGTKGLNVLMGAEGGLLLPLVETAQILGADYIIMDEEKVFTVKTGNTRYLTTLGEHELKVVVNNRITETKELQDRFLVYNDKSLAPGEFFQLLSGRQWIQDGEIGILLPEGLELNDKEAGKLLAQAQKLY